MPKHVRMLLPCPLPVDAVRKSRPVAETTPERAARRPYRTRCVLCNRVAGALALLIGALALAGCSAGGEDEAAGETTTPRVVQPGAPGEEPRELTPEEIEELEHPAHTEADVEFMQHMVVHHEQALAMTALVPDRAARDDLPLFARRLEVSQEDEIAQMQRWLAARDEEPTHESAHDHAIHVPGMLTQEELAELESASGHAFDVLFLQSMIRHHQGALEMVEQLQEDGAQEPEISSFVAHVVADQTVEIARMLALLEELEG